MRNMNTLDNVMYFLQRKMIALYLLVMSTTALYAQCDITNATATPVQGTCTQDGRINITVPAAATCNAPPAFATLKNASGTSLFIAPLNADGTLSFLNLIPGTYSVEVARSGSTTKIVSNIVVTTSYEAMVLTPNSTNTSCSAADENNPANGTASISVAKGNGPFLYTLLLGGVSQATFGPTAVRNHTFTGLAPGAYSIQVSDTSASCTSAEARSTTVASTTYTKLKTFYSRTRPDEDVCGSVIYRVATEWGNRAVLSGPTAASATYNGVTVYGEVFLSTIQRGIFDFKGLVPGGTLTNIIVNDGCNTISFPDLPIVAIPNDYLRYEVEASRTGTCVAGLTIKVSGQILGGLPPGRDAFAFQRTNTLRLYSENSPGSGTYTLLQTINNAPQLSDSGGYAIFSIPHVAGVKYRIVAEDDCHTVTKEFTPTVTFENPLLKAVLVERESKLEGTSSIEIRKATTPGNSTVWTQTEPLSYPITATITRTDGSSNITINPTQPYSQAGSYTYNFPMTAVFENNAGTTSGWMFRPYIGNLPTGEYQVVLTDACGDSVTNIINLTEQATYNPTITLEQGCSSVDVLFDMDETHVIDYSLTRLYRDNGGVLGPLFRDYTENPNNLNNGRFSSVPPGNYIMRFTDIPFRTPDTRNDPNYVNFDASTMTFKARNEYQVAFTVPPYEQVAFSSLSMFCDNTNPTTGILAVSTTGIPVGNITYSVWLNSLNPDSDPPTATSGPLAPTVLEYVFTNLNAGTYTVRVITNCGFTEQQDIVVQPGSDTFPDISSNKPAICEGESSTITLPIPGTLFDFVWKNGAGTVIGGNSNSVTVSPTATEVFTVEFKLKSSLGCPTSPVKTKLVTVIVNDPISQVGTETILHNADYTYSVIVELAGVAPFTASGSGAPGTYVGNTWTSGVIAYGTDYNVNFVDSNKCNTINVTGLSPIPPSCFDSAYTGGTTENTKHGITLLQRAGANNGNWPMIRKGAHTALESNNKGFVITRIATADLGKITTPQEGMMVYDTTAGCLKIYDGTIWSCFSIPACP